MSRPTDAVEAIRDLYYRTTKATILRDLERAIALLKSLPDEDARARAAVYMDGLAQMRSEWGVQPAPPRGAGAAPRPPARAGRRR